MKQADRNSSGLRYSNSVSRWYTLANFRLCEVMVHVSRIAAGAAAARLSRSRSTGALARSPGPPSRYGNRPRAIAPGAVAGTDSSVKLWTRERVSPV